MSSSLRPSPNKHDTVSPFGSDPETRHGVVYAPTECDHGPVLGAMLVMCFYGMVIGGILGYVLGWVVYAS